jgi:hypothetical protein
MLNPVRDGVVRGIEASAPMHVAIASELLLGSAAIGAPDLSAPPSRALEPLDA